MHFTHLQLEQLALALIYGQARDISPREAFYFIGLEEGQSAPLCFTQDLIPYSDLGNIEATELMVLLRNTDIAYFSNAELCRLKLLMDNSPHYQDLIELEMPDSEIHLNLEVLLRYGEPDLSPVERPRERGLSIEEFKRNEAEKKMREYAHGMVQRKERREDREVTV